MISVISAQQQDQGRLPTPTTTRESGPDLSDCPLRSIWYIPKFQILKVNENK